MEINKPSWRYGRGKHGSVPSSVSPLGVDAHQTFTARNRHHLQARLTRGQTGSVADVGKQCPEGDVEMDGIFILFILARRVVFVLESSKETICLLTKTNCKLYKHCDRLRSIVMASNIASTTSSRVGVTMPLNCVANGKNLNFR